MFSPFISARSASPERARRYWAASSLILPPHCFRYGQCGWSSAKIVRRLLRQKQFLRLAECPGFEPVEINSAAEFRGIVLFVIDSRVHIAIDHRRNYASQHIDNLQLRMACRREFEHEMRTRVERIGIILLQRELLRDAGGLLTNRRCY